MKVLAGDLGGTKTLLMLAEVADGRLRPLLESRYASSEFDGLEGMLERFLDECGALAAEVESACFGVAGPVEQRADGSQSAHITNLPWRLDSSRLAEHAGVARLQLINDFQAIGHGLDALGDDDLVEIQPGQPLPGAPRALLGAGTGLGIGFLLQHGDGYRPLSSEGSHGEFAAANAEQAELAAFLRQEYPEHLSWDRVLCGGGLVQIYRFLRGRGHHPEAPQLAAAIAAEDPAAAISRFGLERRDPLAQQALELFVTLYGQQAGNLALLVLARGGVFVAGGIAPKILPALRDGRFLEAFRAKGRMRGLMEGFPLHVVVNPKVGLLGAGLAAGRG